VSERPTVEAKRVNMGRLQSRVPARYEKFPQNLLEGQIGLKLERKLERLRCSSRIHA
jgi:hypothetical protein